jgi:hypothetical protein
MRQNHAFDAIVEKYDRVTQYSKQHRLRPVESYPNRGTPYKQLRHWLCDHNL